MARLRISWDPNKESDLAGYTVAVNGGEQVDVGLPLLNTDGKVEYTTPEIELDEAENTIEIRAYDTSRNISSPAAYTLNPPPKKPEGLAVFFVE